MKLSKIIFSFSVLLFLIYIVLLAVKFPSIQERIPIHYSSEGADNFGSKTFLWLEATISTIILIFTGLVLFIPQKMFRKSGDYLEASYEISIKKPTNIFVGYIYNCNVNFLLFFFKRDYLGSS
ncbi:DUF1648 domain-containing protein [Chryseobacterium sp. MMS23-Vi53]|uniref:DUF1648 domain-containing protein n=1 Tax=Chryseobacterium sp. MMS23-Vi53 TaxID=3386644 RepID=UPI0039EAD8AF